MALFKILKGNKSGLDSQNITNGYCYVTLDEQKMYIDHIDNNGTGTRFCLNADHADTADTANKLDCGNIGNSTVPVYFASGVPQTCTSLSLNTSGNAATATTATALSSNAGSLTQPIYFTGGKPAACGSSLNVSVTGSSGSCTGNAATATKLSSAKTITLTGDVSGSTSFDGSGNVSITTTVADNSHNHSSVGAIQSVNPTSQSIASRITYISGGFNLGTGNDQIQLDGMTGDPNHISAPAAGCYNDGTRGNVQIVRFGWPSNNYWTELYMTPNFDGFWHSSVKNGTRSSWKRIWMQGDAVTGAVWNDYAECRESDCEEFGYVLTEVGDDSLTKTTERLSHFAGVSSDTWGFSQGETDKAKTPIAVAGRVLAYPYQDRNNYNPGDCVCAAPGGTVDIMTREEVREWPDRIVGTVSCVPDYEEWGGGEGADRDPVKVNGRIWIKIK